MDNLINMQLQPGSDAHVRRAFLPASVATTLGPNKPFLECFLCLRFHCAAHRNTRALLASPGPNSMPRSPSGLIWRAFWLKTESFCTFFGGAEALGRVLAGSQIRGLWGFGV